MELKVSRRKAERKSEAKQIRREGFIPAILYSPGQAGEKIVLNGSDFQKIIKKIKPGSLSTTIFNLDLDGKATRAIVKDIQYDITTYNIIHLDFETLSAESAVSLNVPIDLINVAECAGVKLGGSLRQIIRFMKVRCLPRDIPTYFELDVRDLGINQTLKLKNIPLPESVRPISKLEEVAVSVTKK